MRILNLTQHAATADQVADGVIELREGEKEYVKELLTFDKIPSKEELEDRAHDLSLFACTYDIIPDDDGMNELQPNAVMLGGAPFFMGTLERWCESVGLVVLYAFSERESIDAIQEDGSVIKKSIFKHKGFVEVF